MVTVFSNLQGADDRAWRVFEFDAGGVEGELLRLQRGQAAGAHRDVKTTRTVLSSKMRFLVG